MRYKIGTQSDRKSKKRGSSLRNLPTMPKYGSTPHPPPPLPPRECGNISLDDIPHLTARTDTFSPNAPTNWWQQSSQHFSLIIPGLLTLFSFILRVRQHPYKWQLPKQSCSRGHHKGREYKTSSISLYFYCRTERSVRSSTLSTEMSILIHY